MKISKLSYAICVLAFCAGFISVQAQDNPAQAAARAALEAKFQPAATTPAPTAIPGILSDPQPATTVQESSGSTTASSGMDADAQTKAQAAAQAKAAAQKQAAIAMKADAMALKAEQDAAKMDTNVQVKVQAAIQAKTAADAAAAQAKKLDELAAQTRDEAAKAKQDAAQLMAAADAATQASVEAQKQADTQKQAIMAEQKRAAAEAQAQNEMQRKAGMAGINVPGKERGLKPMEAPPLPISAAKQSQLDTLLDLYRADRISPSDYQKQRSAILAAP